MVAEKRSHGIHHKRRHGLHQKQTKDFMRTYLPYIPLLVIVGFGLTLSSFWQTPVRSSNGVLAYATDTTINGLLSATNTQRSGAGKSGLSLSSKLSQAAQAKANDMANRNYWSHNTPEGNEPWIFMDQAGYSYSKAGENLAYGFITSSDTVTGWMNSPPHKANLLDTDFTEVGFGYANAENYQDSGPETVVVAMYGKPLTSAVASASTPNVVNAPAKQKATTPAPVTESTEPSPTTVSETIPEPATQTPANAPIPNTEATEPVQTAHSIAKVQTLTNGYAPWSTLAIGILSVACLAYLILKHSLAFRRVLVSSERFVLHHAVFDLTIVSLMAVGVILTRSVGIIL